MTLLALGLAGLVIAIGWAAMPLWTDLSITASEVRKGTDGIPGRGLAASNITAGAALYRLADDTIGLCDADLTLISSTCIGIAVHGCLTGQAIEWQNGGSITLGTTAALTVGETYFTSDTAGLIRPAADIDSGDWITFLGVGVSAVASP